MKLRQTIKEFALSAGILVLTLGVFYSAFLTGRVFLWEDLLYIVYPSLSYQATSLAAGHFPCWLEGLRCGMAYFSEPWAFYPPIWTLALFVQDGKLPSLAVQWYFVIHYFLGGLFAYVFLRELRCDWRACIAGVVIFVFSGFFSLHIIHGGMVPAFMWLPLELFFVTRIVARKWIIGSCAGLILSVELSLLAGFPQSVLYNAYFMAAYWLFSVWLRDRETSSGVMRWVRVGFGECLKMGGIFAAVALLGIFVILSTVQSWGMSARQEFGFAQISDLSLPWYYLIHAVVPNFFGMTNGDGSGVPFWGFNKDTLEYTNWHAGAWMYWEFAFYAGQCALIAVAVLLFNIRILWNTRREAVFFLGALLPILLLMLGRYGGLFNLLYHVAPGFSMFRTPARFSMLLDFCLAVLVAVLVDLLWRERHVLRLKWPLWVLGTGYAALFLWLLVWGTTVFPELKENQLINHSLGQMVVSMVIFTVTAILIVILKRWGAEPVPCPCSGGGIRKAGGRRAPRSSGGVWLPNIAVWALVGVTFLDLYLAFHKFHQGRVNPEDYYADRNGLIAQMAQVRGKEGPFRIAQLRDGKISEEVIFPRNIGYLYTGYEALEGYALFNTKDYGVFNAITNERVRLDIENVGVIANADRATGRLSVMRYTNSLPRVMFYHQVRAFDDIKAICRDLDLGQLKYREVMGVLKEDCQKYGINISAVPGQVRAKVHFTPINSDAYTISYETTAPGIIFISENYYPGWQATVDGKTLPVIKAFGAFKGIVVPEAGSGAITVRFVPKMLRVGLVVSGVSAFILSVIVFLSWSRRRGVEK